MLLSMTTVFTKSMPVVYGIMLLLLASTMTVLYGISLLILINTMTVVYHISMLLSITRTDVYGIRLLVFFLSTVTFVGKTMYDDCCL